VKQITKYILKETNFKQLCYFGHYFDNIGDVENEPRDYYIAGFEWHDPDVLVHLRLLVDLDPELLDQEGEVEEDDNLLTVIPGVFDWNFGICLPDF
jgi:hypothetical protein